jgi:hypothetical protein
MARKSNRIAPHSRQLSHDETTHAIAAQTEAFLELGGIIQHIPNGVSGQIWKPSAHIKLAKRPA